MTRLLVSTVRRHSPAMVASGYLYVIDPERSRVVQRTSIIEPAYKDLETNPRGGMRGSKGISVREDEIVVANSSAMFRFNPQWDCLGIITHPSCAFIHDIAYRGNSLWVAAACSDHLLEFDLSGRLLRSFYMRAPSRANEQLNWKPPLLIDDQGILDGEIDFRNPATHEHIVFDNAHVNSVGFLSNGDILVSMGLMIGLEFAALKRVKMWMMRRGLWQVVLAANRRARKVLGVKPKNLDDTLVARPAKARSAVVRISPDGNRSLCLEIPNMTTPSHSLLVLPDETAVYLNTSESAVIRFDPLRGEILSSTPVAEGFLRGVCKVNERALAIGNKDQVLTFDLATRTVMASLQITDDPTESVFDLKILPPHFSLPPASLADHLAQAAGIFSPEDVLRRATSSSTSVPAGQV